MTPDHLNGLLAELPPIYADDVRDHIGSDISMARLVLRNGIGHQLQHAYRLRHGGAAGLTTRDQVAYEAAQSATHLAVAIYDNEPKADVLRTIAVLAGLLEVLMEEM